MLNKIFACASFCACSLFLTSLLLNDAFADAPLQAPKRTTFVSENKQYLLRSDPQLGTQAMDKNKKLLWKVTGWFRLAFISNDGEYCVTVYEGLNLIPRDYREDMIMLTFWKHGKLLRKLTLKDIVPDKSILQESASHYYWGNTTGINEQGKFGLERADGMRMYFDVRTGKLVDA
ncbi:hypothetical protein [Undibacterium pigrum]|uniref:MORN repeat protein n=1 Tax=Undibacterium pigrum TaxID=401470 RepID=A0A318ITY1_9BURK|nr:hypothetical protein [Undibacterium pigrum]PXX37861.1 hypothetical protein DFR42_11420 [Undibacterium pigrum]